MVQTVVVELNVFAKVPWKSPLALLTIYIL